MKIKRRDFVKLLGGVTGSLALTGFGLDQLIEIPDDLLEKARSGPGIETWKNTICGQCPGGCGLKVRLVDDIPVYIKGNPTYPINRGGMCPMGHSSLEVLYNPDRIKSPLKRIGIPGRGRWEPITWDEALSTISQRLTSLRSKNKSHHVAFLGSDERGLMKEHISRFMEAYGSPNYFRLSPAEFDGVPFQLTQGHAFIPAYDFPNAKLVVSFGSNFLEEGYSPIYYTRLFSQLRDTVGGDRTRFVQIDSRMSLTAANADQWVPVKPGTYGALALGLAHVLVREELIDAKFVAAHTSGFEDWTDREGRKHRGFKTYLLEDYYPERVWETTGVPAETILELARTLGNTRPALVLGNQGAVDNTNGTFTQMAVHSLNALLGNFEEVGGLFAGTPIPFDEFPKVNLNETAREGNRQTPIDRANGAAISLSPFSIKGFTQNVLAEKPYPIELLFLYKGNPLFQTLNHHDLSEALRRIPLVVSFSSFIDETAEYADLILPDHTFLEKWDESSGVPSVGFEHVGLQQPIVDPFFDTRHTGDVLIDLARRLPEPVAAAFPFEHYQDEIRHCVQGLYESGKGAISSEVVQDEWLGYLQQRGWHIGRYDSFDAFWSLLLEHGGWWNPIRAKQPWGRIFQTPSGRFEFYSLTLKQALESMAGAAEFSGSLDTVLRRLNIRTQGDNVFIPHHEPAIEDEDGRGLNLITFQTLPNRNGSAANQPLMQELFGYTVRRPWESWVEINPVTAEQYGVSDGAWVWVQSSLGSIRVRAKVHPGIMPGVVCIPFGMGHTSYGRYARGYGVNPNTIMNNLYDELSGRPALQATRVELSLTT